MRGAAESGGGVTRGGGAGVGAECNGVAARDRSRNSLLMSRAVCTRWTWIFFEAAADDAREIGGEIGARVGDGWADRRAGLRR